MKIVGIPNPSHGNGNAKALGQHAGNNINLVDFGNRN